MGEAPPSAHGDGGRTPAGDRAVDPGTRRKPGFPRAAREAAAGARPVARTTVPDRRGKAVAPDTGGQARHTVTLFEEKIQHHQPEVTQETNENPAFRNQNEKPRQE